MKEIAQLKKHVSESNNLSEAVDYFFDLMGTDNFLYGVGNRRVEDIENRQELCVAIEAAIHIAGDLLDKKINIINQVFTEIPQEKFFHGYCILSNHPIPLLVLYCADLQVGIFALMESSGTTNFCRFCLAKSEDLKNKH